MPIAEREPRESLTLNEEGPYLFLAEPICLCHKHFFDAVQMKRDKT